MNVINFQHKNVFGSKNLQNTGYKIEYDSQSMNTYFNGGDGGSGGCGGGGDCGCGSAAAADSCALVSRT